MILNRLLLTLCSLKRCFGHRTVYHTCCEIHGGITVFKYRLSDYLGNGGKNITFDIVITSGEVYDH